jgi:hypothetical protein
MEDIYMCTYLQISAFDDERTMLVSKVFSVA